MTCVLVREKKRFGETEAEREREKGCCGDVGKDVICKPG